MLSNVTFNIDFHPNKGVVFLEVDDVFITHAYASFAAASGNTIAVACAAMDAYACTCKISLEPQKPCPVGKHGSAAVVKIVSPRGCILDAADGESLAVYSFGSTHISLLLLVAAGGTEADRIGRYYGCLVATRLIYKEGAFGFGDVYVEISGIYHTAIHSSVAYGGGVMAIDRQPGLG